MNTLPLVAQLAGFTTLVTFIWLLARAFGKHAGWGMAVLLFSPISAVIFGIKHWKYEKVPFLAYMTASITTIALFLYLFTAWGGWELLRTSQQVQWGISSQSLTERDVQALMTISQSFDEQSGFDMQSSPLLLQAQRKLVIQAEQQAAEAAAEAEAARREQSDSNNITWQTEPAQERYRLAYVTINVSDAPNYVGATVKVTRKNVLEKEYRLIGASGNRLEFSQKAGSGSYTFKYRKNDIEKIRVLTKQPY
ncbi:MAG: hypothetical protein ABFS24_00620 [Pseudomonadota bacterium]